MITLFLRQKSTVLCRHVFCLVLGVSLLAGCVNASKDSNKNAATSNAHASEITAAPAPEKRSPNRELSLEAKSVYAFLLCEEAYNNEDEAAILEALPLLEELRANPQIWMEIGIWLLGRKSEISEYFLTHARSIWPEDTSLLMLQAEAYQTSNRLNEAIDLIRNFLQTHPSAPLAQLELAILLVQRKDFAEAEAILKNVSKEDRTPLVDFHQGKALAGLTRYDKAIPYLQRAVKAMPDFAEASIELGLCYERLGKNDLAIRSYENVLKTDFPSKNVLLHIINLSLRMKRPEQALKYMEAGPDDIPFKLVCADLFLESKHYLQASNILEPLTRRNDTPVEVYLLLCDITWEHMRDLKGALKWLDAMPDAYRKSGQVLLLRTQIYAKANKKEEALLEAREGKKLFPEETKFWEAEARILAMQSKMPDAISVMREAVKKWPNDMGMLFLLGNILDEAGDKKAAFSLMEKIIERDPDNFQALNYVGYTLADSNRELDRAIELLERASRIAPDRAYIVDSLAWAYFRAGRQSDALREIRRSVKLDVALDPAIWEHYGDIAQSAGLFQEAKDAYVKALELEPENAETLRRKISQ